MKKILVLFMFIATCMFAKQDEILLLHSYNKGLKWSDGISKGVEDVFKKHPNFELTTEYMDSKKIDSKEYFDSLVKLYTKKFSNRRYKAIITADNYAFKFALDNYERLFKGIPIVFCGVENFDKKEIPIHLQSRIAGVIEYKSIKRNIELIRELIKNLKTIYIMSDNSYSSLEIKAQILDVAKEYNNRIEIIYDNDIALESIDKKLDKLPSNSAILFTSFYKDKYGRYIPYTELESFFRSSKFPIIALNKIHLGHGVVGGVMINPYEQGNMAAKMVFDIVNGKNPLQLDIAKPLARYYFDDEVFKKYNLERSKVPIMSTFINEPKSFFEKNRKFVDSVFLMMPILLLLIIGLIVNIVKKTKLEIQLVEQNKLDNVLLNNVKNSIFWKSNDDYILGCNDSFYKLLGLEKSQIIGKKIDELIPEFCQNVNSSDDFMEEVELNLTINKKNLDVILKRKQYHDKNNQQAGVVTVIEDITEVKKLQLQRKKDEQFLIQRSKLSEIGEMMTSVAHQWKAPLVEISTIAQEFLYKKKKQNTITQEYAQEIANDIMNQVGYMTKTIDDFRAFIKPSSKKTVFDIKNAITELLNIVEHNIKYNYINLHVGYKDDEAYEVFGYPNEFKQSLLNIINNAVDSILQKREHQEFQGEILIDIYKKDALTCINIKDNGVGIKQGNLKLIFEPYNTSKKNGDGFGLYMAKVIIEDKMDGEVKALECTDGASFLVCIKSVEKGGK